jgi:conjugal transfer/entry exclusion protein
MSKIVDGIETKLTESVSFNVVTLANVTLETQNRRDLADFQQKVSDLQSTLRAVENLIDDIENRLNKMRVAAKSVKEDNVNILSDIQGVQSRLNDIKISLYGDRLSSRLDIDRSPSISDRINSAVYGTISATSTPTQTHRDGYQIAREELEPILREIQQIFKREIVSIENVLDRVGAPYTPGRIPQLNRDSRR